MDTTNNVTAIAAIDAITAHTRKVRGAPATEIEIPEWGFTIYVHPATVSEEDEIKTARSTYEFDERLKTGKPADGDYQELLATLIVRAKNKDGSRIFQFAQIKELKGFAMGDVFRRVVREINQTELTPEEVAKNS